MWHIAKMVLYSVEYIITFPDSLSHLCPSETLHCAYNCVYSYTCPVSYAVRLSYGIVDQWALCCQQNL
jgi:hypothetical protein